MRGFTLFLLIVAAAAATARAAVQSNPHVFAAKHAKRSVAPVLTRDAPRTRSTSKYLTQKTKGESL